MDFYSEYKKALIKDILFMLVVVLITIPIWLSFDMASISMEANSYENYDYIKYEFF